MSQENHHGNEEESRPNGIVRHRTSLPASMFSRNDFSIWSILRKCIGMELSKMTMPVILNEPLSFLQRLTEYTIEQYGNVEVLNHKTGERCCLNFKPCGLFGKELHKVEGYILDKSKKKVCSLYGKWTECMYIVDYAALEAHKKSGKGTVEKKSSKPGSRKEVEEISLPEADTVEVIPGSYLLWRIAPRPVNSTQMYSFTLFAMQLNELDKDMDGLIPKTDCRLRPDIRAMENGDIDLASEEKKRLEEKQRAACKTHSKSDDELKTKNPALGPRWFQQGQNPHNGSQDWLFSTGYWNRNYPLLPDIY